MLNREQIKDEISQGGIVIPKMDPMQIGPNSIDVRLGEYIYYPRDTDWPILDPLNYARIKDYWMLRKHKYGEGVIIPAQTTVLAHTDEFVWTRNGLVCLMHARSSIARLGLSVCKCAGFGDNGYRNRWTLEISNHNKRQGVALYIGMRIAQLEITSIDPTEEYDGKYNGATSVEKMIEKWQPEDMLPKFDQEWDRGIFQGLPARYGEKW